MGTTTAKNSLTGATGTAIAEKKQKTSNID